MVIRSSRPAIVLKVRERILFEKSRKQLLDLKHGLKWYEQMEREVNHLEQDRSRANS